MLSFHDQHFLQFKKVICKTIYAPVIVYVDFESFINFELIINLLASLQFLGTHNIMTPYKKSLHCTSSTNVCYRFMIKIVYSLKK